MKNVAAPYVQTKNITYKFETGAWPIIKIYVTGTFHFARNCAS